MNKNMFASLLVVALVGIAYFYFMANGVEAPAQTEDIDQPETAVKESAPEPEAVPDQSTEPTADKNQAIIGMRTAEAKAYAAANNIMFRVGINDGEFLALTMDYRPGRITAEIEGGIVTGYSVE